MYRERVLLPHGFVLEILFAGEKRWRLCLRKGKRRLVDYSSDLPYDFKSVEQLRYDFEKDAEIALHQGR